MAENEDRGKEIELELRSIKSMFETGEIKKMYEISKLYPTKIIRALGLNHGRYVDKLAKPEKFSIDEIIRFSRLIGVDHRKVIEIILTEAVPNVIAREGKSGKPRTPKKAIKSSIVKKKKKGG
jgi:hypothetical protein